MVACMKARNARAPCVGCSSKLSQVKQADKREKRPQSKNKTQNAKSKLPPCRFAKQVCGLQVLIRLGRMKGQRHKLLGTTTQGGEGEPPTGAFGSDILRTGLNAFCQSKCMATFRKIPSPPQSQLLGVLLAFEISIQEQGHIM